MGALHMNKNAAKGYFGTMGSIATDFEARTRALGGTEELAVWEIDFEMTMQADVPGLPYGKGERAKMQGVCLVTWDEGKIVKQADYFCWVKKDEKVEKSCEKGAFRLIWTSGVKTMLMGGE